MKIEPMFEDKKIPWSSESEAVLLGSLMKENSVLDKILFLTPNNFYGSLHQKIFYQCRTMIENGELANPVTLRTYFKDESDALNGRYLIQCCSYANGSMRDVVSVAKYIKKLAECRELIKKCEEVVDELYRDPMELLGRAAIISDSCEKILAGDKQWQMREGTEVTQAIINDMNQEKSVSSTGMKRLDKAMDGGLYAGKLYGFAGLKKHGKTIMAGTLSVNLAKEGKKHLFICGEMSAEEIHQRNLARMGGFFPSAFRSGYSKSAEFQDKFNTALQWQQNNIVFVNAPALTFEKLKHIVKQAVLKYDIKGYILDYWQLVGGKEPKKSTAEHLDEVAQWLADSAKKYGIFVVTMAQINQEGNTRGGEGLRLACDQLYQIHRPDLSAQEMWLEMMDTRYTPWVNIGSKENSVLSLNPQGPYFEEL